MLPTWLAQLPCCVHCGEWAGALKSSALPRHALRQSATSLERRVALRLRNLSPEVLPKRACRARGPSYVENDFPRIGRVASHVRALPRSLPWRCPPAGDCLIWLLGEEMQKGLVCRALPERIREGSARRGAYASHEPTSPDPAGTTHERDS